MARREHQKRGEHPILRTIRILSDDLKNLTRIKEHSRRIKEMFPRHVDVVIIGGGAMGSSIAYWLKEKSSREALDVVVLEKDLSVSSRQFVCNVGVNN